MLPCYWFNRVVSIHNKNINYICSNAYWRSLFTRSSEILIVLGWWGGRRRWRWLLWYFVRLGRRRGGLCSKILFVWGWGDCLLLNFLTPHQPLGVVWKYEILNIKTFHLMCAIPTLSELWVLHLTTSPHHSGRFRKYDTLKYSSLEIW